MRIEIRKDNFEITEKLKEQIESKLSKFERYFTKPEEIIAKVVVRERYEEQIIEITIHTPKFTIRAETSQEDIYAALNLTIDKLTRQMNKNKKKLHQKYKEDVKLFLDENDEEEKMDLIVNKRKRLELKPMSEEEAILQLELIDHNFFIFKNSETDKICVVYKRCDTSYGIIEAE